MSDLHPCACKSRTEPLALSAADVGRLLGISARQVWAWDSGGQLGPAPGKMSERITRWDSGEVTRWWAACLAAGRRIGRTEWSMMQEANR